MSLRLRDYQQRAKDLYVKSLVTHHTAPLLVAPTGAGKTVIAVSIMEDLLSQGFQVFFLAPRKELIDQTSRKLDEAGMNDHGVIMAGHWRVRPRARCQVCSQQTLINRLHHIGKADRIAVFCDEAHHAVSPTIKKIKEHAEAQADIFLFIGMTATPYRADGKGLGEVFDDLIEVASLHELTQREYLVPAVEFVGEHIDLTGIGIVAGDLNQKKAATRYADKRIIGSAVRQYEEHAAGRKFVLFATDIENSKMYAKMFSDSGIPCAHLDGTMAKGVRQGILSRHQSGELVGVSNYGVLTEGYDDPEIGCIINMRPTMSRGLLFQMLGRGLRPIIDRAGLWALNPDYSIRKPDCKILDFANYMEMHGSVYSPIEFDLKDGVKPKEKREASEEKEPEDRVEVVQLTIPVEEDVRLVEARFDPGKIAETQEERLRRQVLVFDDACQRAIRGDYNPKWIGTKFQRAIGKWPSFSVQARTEYRLTTKPDKQLRLLCAKTGAVLLGPDLANVPRFRPDDLFSATS